MREVFHALDDTLRISAQPVDANGNPVTRIEIAWSSSDEAVVTVDETGLVTAVGNGHARVTVTAGSHSEAAEFTVEQLPTAIQVSPAADTLRGLGDTLRMSAEVFDANRHAVENAEFAWLSSDELVATVDAQGLVTATGAGCVDITADVAGSEISETVTLLVEILPAREALVALYNATGGPNWANSENWLTDAPLHDWYGVRAGQRDGLPNRRRAAARRERSEGFASFGVGRSGGSPKARSLRERANGPDPAGTRKPDDSSRSEPLQERTDGGNTVGTGPRHTASTHCTVAERIDGRSPARPRESARPSGGWERCGLMSTG